jgi:MOSC domain-containing protein YiiM
MASTDAVDAVAGQGLRGDRFFGQVAPGDEETCEVTLIEGEHLEEMARAYEVRLLAGEHRRNIVTRGVVLERLQGRAFRVGSAVLVYQRVQPPCRRIAELTQTKVPKALGRRSGICARIVQTGRVAVGDTIEVLAEIP